MTRSQFPMYIIHFRNRQFQFNFSSEISQFEQHIIIMLKCGVILRKLAYLEQRFYISKL